MSFDMVHEIIQAFEKLETRQQRLDLLKKQPQSFVNLMTYAFHQGIEFDAEIPSYRPSPEPEGLNFLYLLNEVDQLYKFIRNHPKRPAGLTPRKQRELLLVMLESLHKKEAEILVSIMTNKFKVNYLTVGLLKEAYPNINL